MRKTRGQSVCRGMSGEGKQAFGRASRGKGTAQGRGTEKTAIYKPSSKGYTIY